MRDLERAWQRSDAAANFPKKWIRKDGYVVRDVTSDLAEYVIQHMVSLSFLVLAHTMQEPNNEISKPREWRCAFAAMKLYIIFWFASTYLAEKLI